MAGWIKLYREIRDHWIYKDPDHLKVWMEILLVSKYSKEPKTDCYKGILYTLNYAEFVFGRPTWSERLGIGERKLRTLIERLQSEGMIVLVSQLNKFTIYKVVNFEKYNQQNDQVNDLETSEFEACDVQQKDQQTSSKRPAPDQQTSSNKKEKNDKNVKKVKKEKPIVDFTIQINSYTDNQELVQVLKDYLQHRKDKNSPIASETQFKTFLKTLDKHENKIEVLERSIANGWTGIFEIKDSNQNKTQTKGDVKNGVMHCGEFIDFNSFSKNGSNR